MMTLIAYVFPKLRTGKKRWLDKCLKYFFSEYYSTVNMLKGPKHCSNLDDSTFIMFLYHSEGNEVKNCLS